MLQAKDVSPALGFKMKSLEGKEVDLASYQGKVVLIVNVASKCGLTPQYSKLQELHEKYHEKGLVVLGVPCNQFGGQEPGSPEEIKTFCSTKYGVDFPLLAKVDVNGDSACDLYKHLTSLETKPTAKGKISWNFEKFLVGRDGKVVARYAPKTEPDATEVLAAVEAELKK
ncbi:MAG: glutathione peroxidase [Planctomycetota bacterium]|nr:glutathione peroxidase [Planctomycetota bacterium]